MLKIDIFRRNLLLLFSTFYLIIFNFQAISIYIYIYISISILTEVPEPSLESEWSCKCVGDIYFLSFYYFLIGFWNWSNSVIFGFSFHYCYIYLWFLLNCQPSFTSNCVNDMSLTPNCWALFCNSIVIFSISTMVLRFGVSSYLSNIACTFLHVSHTTKLISAETK